MLLFENIYLSISAFLIYSNLSKYVCQLFYFIYSAYLSNTLFIFYWFMYGSKLIRLTLSSITLNLNGDRTFSCEFVMKYIAGHGLYLAFVGHSRGFFFQHLFTIFFYSKNPKLCKTLWYVDRILTNSNACFKPKFRDLKYAKCAAESPKLTYLS